MDVLLDEVPVTLARCPEIQKRCEGESSYSTTSPSIYSIVCNSKPNVTFIESSDAFVVDTLDLANSHVALCLRSILRPSTDWNNGMRYARMFSISDVHNATVSFSTDFASLLNFREFLRTLPSKSRNTKAMAFVSTATALICEPAVPRSFATVEIVFAIVNAVATIVPIPVTRPTISAILSSILIVNVHTKSWITSHEVEGWQAREDRRRRQKGQTSESSAA